MNQTRSESALPFLATPLVVLTTILVTVLSVIMMFVEPGKLERWVVSLVFLPAALGGLWFIATRTDKPSTARWFGKVRAGLVGAGVLLATALAFALTDALGITGEDGQLEGRPLLMLLPAVVAAMAEIIGMRLERKAEQDPDRKDD